jgi:hypothetical protein
MPTYLFTVSFEARTIGISTVTVIADSETEAREKLSDNECGLQEVKEEYYEELSYNHTDAILSEVTP